MEAEQNTFVFADLAGFTALTEAHGDQRAADIAIEFAEALDSCLGENAEIIKLLGDGCFLRVHQAAAAVELSLDIVARLAPQHGFPDVCVGMNTGGAVRRNDDWYGGTINVAARLTQLAGPGEVLLTEQTRRAAGDLAGVEFEDRGVATLRHVVDSPRIFRATRLATTTDLESFVVDPVCLMRLSPDLAQFSEVRDGERFYFCSSECAQRFADDPVYHSRAAGARPD